MRSIFPIFSTCFTSLAKSAYSACFVHICIFREFSGFSHRILPIPTYFPRIYRILLAHFEFLPTILGRLLSCEGHFQPFFLQILGAGLGHSEPLLAFF